MVNTEKVDLLTELTVSKAEVSVKVLQGEEDSDKH